MAATYTEHSYLDAEGVTIHYKRWAVDAPKAVIQLVHGLGEHSGRWHRVADDLVAAGYTVYADDHRGHGRTGLDQHGGDVTRLGRLGPGGHRATVAALRQFTGIIRGQAPGVPLIVIAQSWGSIMVQIILNEHPEDYDAVVLTGTAYRTLRHMNSGDLNKRHKHLGSTGSEWLSRDPAVAQAFADDPHTFYADVMKLFGIRDGLRLLGRPAVGLSRDVPLLIMVGSDDSLGGEESARRLAEAYVERSGFTDVTVEVYTDARHEVLNETNRAEVLADLLEWLDTRARAIGPRGAGRGR